MSVTDHEWGRGRNRRSYDAQEESECAIDPQEQSVTGFPGHAADFGNGNKGDFVIGDLRNFTQSIALRRIGFEPERIRIIAKRRHQRANHHGRQFGEKIALHDKRGTQFAVVPRGRNGHALIVPQYGPSHS
jgi:hypothetical protein